ncbi:MAG TPA: diguanylate cyclase, partial [Thermoanaerobaculia bacterium]|nr:diguanylate cyclase [Thermoanaerobaculia bacterium]
MDEPATDVRESTDGAQEAAAPAVVASLVSDLRAAKAELEARNEALRLVNDLAFRLQRRLDPEAIAVETAEALRGGSAPPLVAIYLLDGPDGPLRLVAGRGFTEEELDLGARLPLEGSASGRAIRERRIVSLGEVRIEGREVHPVVDALARRRVASGLCVPLAHGGRSLGTLNVLYPEGRDLRPEEAETFEGVARAVSLAVANAQYRTELEERAYRDALTGLPNRAGFHRRFGTLAEAVGGGRAALVLLDLDWFREINDTLGHNFGDELLVQVG